jgi:hypothetical protein
LAPSAGPTGGDGLAAPPLICNLIKPSTSFAISNFSLYTYRLQLVDNHTGSIHGYIIVRKL